MRRRRVAEPTRAPCVGAPPHAASMAATRQRQNSAGNVQVRGRRHRGGRIIHQRRANPAGADAVKARRSSLRFAASTPQQGEHNLAKPNFGYQKRQKELEKKRKKEEKMKKKLEKNAAPARRTRPPPRRKAGSPLDVSVGRHRLARRRRSASTSGAADRGHLPLRVQSRDLELAGASRGHPQARAPRPPRHQLVVRAAPQHRPRQPRIPRAAGRRTQGHLRLGRHADPARDPPPLEGGAGRRRTSPTTTRRCGSSICSSCRSSRSTS